MAPAESVDFYCVQFFLIILMGVTTSKLFTCWSGTQSLSVLLFFSFLSKHMLNKKDAQLESCKLSFIWGKMRTAPWEAASQIALRDCSKAAVGESQYIKFGEKWKWSRIWLFATPWTVAFQASPSMGFSRQEYWSGLPFPSPGDLPDPGIEPSLPHCRQTL